MARTPDTLNIRKRVVLRNGKKEAHYQVRLQVRDHLGKLRRFVETFEDPAGAVRWRDIMRGQGRLGDIGERDALSRAIQAVTLGTAIAKYQDAPVFVRKALAHKTNKRGSDEAGMLATFAKREANGLCKKLIVDLNSLDLQDYVERRLNDGVLIGTIKRELNPIRVMFKYATKHWQYPRLGHLFEGLFEDYRDELNAHRERTLKPAEHFKILNALAELRNKANRRMWLALFVTAKTTAIRRGELLQLEMRDLDLRNPGTNTGNNTISIRRETAKNRKPRLLPLSADASYHLRCYLEALADGEKSPTARVFPITPGAHEQAWRRICKRASINHRDLHFHDLRHTATTSFVQKPIELTVPELNWMLKGKLFEDRVLNVYANPEVRDMVESIRAKLDRAERAFDAAQLEKVERGQKEDLSIEDIADLRLTLAHGPWLDRWDWIERDGKVVIDWGGPKSQETIKRLRGRTPYGGDDSLERDYQYRRWLTEKSRQQDNQAKT
jgi:integrase